MSQLTTSSPITIGHRQFIWGVRTYVMGIVNATPDSFSGDGLALDVDAAVRQALQMIEDGADIIDVGGESTRPDADELPAEEEMRRVIPVIERLSQVADVPISVDTYKAEVARAAFAAGAHIVNDIHGFRNDPEVARVAAEASVPAVAMHNQRGRDFHDTIGDIAAGLLESLRISREAGLPEDRV
ncbi:MAG TPA: dihydropteroate synthase, partial [Dehalococcoidia bacterium]|nr:dihydropteroate synthase [Dehalococcoidia bacterium]